LIDQLLLIISLITIYEFIKYIKLKVLIYLNLNIYKKFIKAIILKNITDYRKEKLIFSYARKLFFVSIKILAIILAILILMSFFRIFSNTFLNLVFSTYGIFEMIFVFLIYHKFRVKINAKL
jgi:hypothetical protein